MHDPSLEVVHHDVSFKATTSDKNIRKCVDSSCLGELRNQVETAKREHHDMVLGVLQVRKQMDFV